MEDVLLAALAVVGDIKTNKNGASRRLETTGHGIGSCMLYLSFHLHQGANPRHVICSKRQQQQCLQPSWSCTCAALPHMQTFMVPVKAREGKLSGGSGPLSKGRWDCGQDLSTAGVI